MRTTACILGAALLMAASCTEKRPLETMQAGERGRVVRIIDGDALVLDTGQSVRLVGIEAPALNPRYGDPAPYAEESARTLEDLVMGRTVQLFYPGLTRDKYDRALAHLRTIDGAGPAYWVNLELVRRGAARLRLYPDTDAQGERLLEAEREARREGAGLWKLAAYAPEQADGIDADARGFRLVSGTLGEAAAPSAEAGNTYACARAMGGAGLVIDIMPIARAACDMPAGTPVELRGWVNGGRMDLIHPLHVQLRDPG